MMEQQTTAAGLDGNGDVFISRNHDHCKLQWRYLSFAVRIGNSFCKLQ